MFVWQLFSLSANPAKNFSFTFFLTSFSSQISMRQNSIQLDVLIRICNPTHILEEITAERHLQWEVRIFNWATMMREIFAITTKTVVSHYIINTSGFALLESCWEHSTCEMPTEEKKSAVEFEEIQIEIKTAEFLRPDIIFKLSLTESSCLQGWWIDAWVACAY
jgi:hypothetical protein